MSVFQRFHGIGDEIAALIDSPTWFERFGMSGGQFDFAQRHRARGHVEAKWRMASGWGGEGDWVGSEHWLSTKSRDHGGPPDGSRRNTDEPVLGSHHGVSARRSV